MWQLPNSVQGHSVSASFPCTDSDSIKCSRGKRGDFAMEETDTAHLRCERGDLCVKDDDSHHNPQILQWGEKGPRDFF